MKRLARIHRHALPGVLRLSGWRWPWLLSLRVLRSLTHARPARRVRASTSVRTSSISGAHSDTSAYGKPAIAFDGQNFLIAWHDAAASAASTVHASRVTPDGEILHPAGIPLPLPAWDSGPAAVSFDGENYMLVWDATQDDVSWELFCARVTPSGDVVAPGVQQLTTGSGCWGGRPLGISFDGSEFMVVFRTTDTQIRGLRVSRSGASLDGPTGFAITLDGKYPAVAFDGTNFFVVLAHRRPRLSRRARHYGRSRPGPRRHHDLLGPRLPGARLGRVRRRLLPRRVGAMVGRETPRQHPRGARVRRTARCSTPLP